MCLWSEHVLTYHNAIVNKTEYLNMRAEAFYHILYSSSLDSFAAECKFIYGGLNRLPLGVQTFAKAFAYIGLKVGQVAWDKETDKFQLQCRDDFTVYVAGSNEHDYSALLFLLKILK